jgi:hypothetical protein
LPLNVQKELHDSAHLATAVEETEVKLLDPIAEHQTDTFPDYTVAAPVTIAAQPTQNVVSTNRSSKSKKPAAESPTGPSLSGFLADKILRKHRATNLATESKQEFRDSQVSKSTWRTSSTDTAHSHALKRIDSRPLNIAKWKVCGFSSEYDP